MIPKFIRFKNDIIHLGKIVDINYKDEQDVTVVHYDTGNSQAYRGGDYRDDIWALMKLALRPPVHLQDNIPKELSGTWMAPHVEPAIKYEDPTGIR